MCLIVGEGGLPQRVTYLYIDFVVLLTILLAHEVRLGGLHIEQVGAQGLQIGEGFIVISRMKTDLDEELLVKGDDLVLQRLVRVRLHQRNLELHPACLLHHSTVSSIH